MECRSVAFLVHGAKVLLARRKGREGAGMLGGFGGVVLPHESPEDTIFRETRRLGGIELTTIHLVAQIKVTSVARLKTHTRISSESLSNVFFVTAWEGDIRETLFVQRPYWFQRSQLPYRWLPRETRYWLYPLLFGARIRADFVVDYETKNVLWAAVNFLAAPTEGFDEDAEGSSLPSALFFVVYF